MKNPKKVEYVHDERTGKTTRIDVCYVGAYESNQPRRRAASGIGSCDYETQNNASSELSATKEPVRKISNLRKRKPKMNIYLKMYLIMIGAILLAERPQVNFAGLNQKLVY